MSAFTSTTISCFYDRFLLVLYSRLSYSCRAFLFCFNRRRVSHPRDELKQLFSEVSVRRAIALRSLLAENLFFRIEKTTSACASPRVAIGWRVVRLQPMCSSRWTIPLGAAVLTIPFGPTWNIEWNYQAFTPAWMTGRKNSRSPFLLFTDKAVPANRECGLYDIPDKKH